MGYKKTVVVGFFLFGLVVLSAISTYYVAIGECKEASYLSKSFNENNWVLIEKFCAFIVNCIFYLSVTLLSSVLRKSFYIS